MNITGARVIVTSPGRNFVTLKILTDEGVHGIGDATLNGRELAVAAYLSEHVVPCLIGRDPHRIEDTWQYLYRGAYWRRGPVTMAAIAAVDTALWDIKAKVVGLPLYQLLGGRSRDGVMVYGHANGRDIAETVAEVGRYLALGYRAVRAQCGIPGLPSDLSPICMGASLHLNLAIANFGIQEYMRHTPETDAVFPHAYTFADGYLYPGETPGHGVDIDEDAAARFPYRRAYLPINRLEDGTLWSW
jgi:L-alanine-DL-glutamate epimerase-like enolase superfamily enzyme